MKFFYQRITKECVSPVDNPNIEMVKSFYIPNAFDAFFFGTLQDIHKLQELGYPTRYFCNFENFKYTTYSKYYYKYLLNAPYMVIHFNELLTHSNDIFASFGIDNTIFMRPDNGDKPFTGNIIYKEDFTKELLDIEKENLDTLCIISYPKQYNKFNEYRTWIVDNKVVEASSYRIKGEFETEASVPQEVIDYAQNVVDNVKWQPDPAFVLDVVEYDGKYKVVELNSMSSSGLYNASIVKICEALQEYFDRNP